MSDLVVIAYNDMHKANEVRSMLMKMSKEYLLDLEDAVVAVKKEDGKVKLQQMYNLTAAGALTGGFWGLLIGLLFLNPILGLAIGAGAGAASGALTDMGVSDDFVKEIAANFKPGTSLLLVLFNKATHDKVLEELVGTGGKVIKTSLTHEDEKILQHALNGCLAADGCKIDAEPVTTEESPVMAGASTPAAPVQSQSPARQDAAAPAV